MMGESGDFFPLGLTTPPLFFYNGGAFLGWALKAFGISW